MRKLIVATRHCLLLLVLLSLTTRGYKAPALERGGFGTVRARLAMDGLGTVRVRLARLIFLGCKSFKNQAKRKV